MLPKTPSKLLLLDGIGAVVTAGGMALVLAPFQRVFGLPAGAAYGLAILGALFACYSLSGALGDPSRSRARLRTIAIANLAYSALSLVLLAYHQDVLAPFGYAYLGAEVVIVVLLANYELKIARLSERRTSVSLPSGI